MGVEEVKRNRPPVKQDTRREAGRRNVCVGLQEESGGGGGGDE